MKKEDISLILSCIAIIISIAAICRSFHAEEELGIDYLGIIVGMLAFLTAILIAFVWNGYALRDKEIDKKLCLLQNSSKKAIAEDMFYTAYSELMNAGVSYGMYKIAQKKVIASLNLDFSEEKAELAFGEQQAKYFIFTWGREDEIINNVTFRLKRSYFKKKGSKKGGQSTSLISNSPPNGLISLVIKSMLALNLPDSILLIVVLVKWAISESWLWVKPLLRRNLFILSPNISLSLLIIRQF